MPRTRNHSRSSSAARALIRAAESLGIQTSFLDSSGERQHATSETLERMIGIIGDAPRTDPVLVQWQQARPVSLTFPGSVEVALVREDGVSEVLRGQRTRGERRFTLPALETGYHKLIVELSGQSREILVIAAPPKLYTEPVHDWGAFLPLYAAHSENSWGAANFSDWTRLCRWIGAQGGKVAGTLPILSAFLDFPVCEPSPYSPASRLFWNEFFIDLTAIPEFHHSSAARKAVSTAKRSIETFRRTPFIEYSAEWALRRKVLTILAREFRDSPRQREFRDYLRARPEAELYARFRAACEEYRSNWRTWPARLEYSDETKNFYLYIQWVAQQQIDSTLTACREADVKFYLDLPLGVNPDGFDAWRYQDFFALGVSAGAPPDSFFTKGQDWGFAPLHPQHTRAHHYRYVIDYLRFQMRHTGLLRIDHVMGLHRLWWVPHGRPASEGAYVRYPAHELYAILSVESHRHKTMLVGENLGTVPPEVNKAMDRHGVRRMYVLQYEGAPPREPEKREVASVNTHDMPSFAAHWTGADLADRHDLGLIPSKALPAEKRNRARTRAALIAFLRKRKLLQTAHPKPRQVLEAVLKFLATSDAEILLVNLEDLWLEERSQNVPGTSTQRPNWRRKSALTLEQIESDSSVSAILKTLSSFR